MQLLEDVMYPVCIDIIENDQQFDEDHLIFLHDGAPPLYAFIIHQYLRQHCPRN